MSTDGNYTFDVTWDNAFPCGNGYSALFMVRFTLDCGGTSKEVVAVSSQKWCLVNDTCIGEGWVGPDGTCYSVGMISVP